MINVFSSFGESTRVLVTGGAGFIGGALVRRLLACSDSTIFNLDKCGYASDLTGINQAVESLGPDAFSRHNLLHVDLIDAHSTQEAVRKADPDFVLHLAAESHVDRSIDHPSAFLDSNVTGTFNILTATRGHWESLPKERQERFRFLHISTDEVFGSLGSQGRFSETTPYDPRSPYSASKASSDHLVKAWHHTYGLPILLTNCSNNYGPWQFPEKLIPIVIIKALEGKSIPLYGDGLNVRDWLFVEDHIDALLLVLTKGVIGKSYCVGGNSERTNKQIVQEICSLLDRKLPQSYSYCDLITSVKDRPGHDRRYAIDPTLIQRELGWSANYSFEQGLALTIEWYLGNIHWCEQLQNKAGYQGERIGLA